MKSERKGGGKERELKIMNEAGVWNITGLTRDV